MNLSKLYSNRGNHSFNKSNIALLNKSSSQKRTQKYNQDRQDTQPANTARHYNNHMQTTVKATELFSSPKNATCGQSSRSTEVTAFK